MRPVWILLLPLTVGTSAVYAQAPTPLTTVTVAAASQQGMTAFDGVIESERQIVIAAQVAGAVVQIDIKAGQSVQAGQTLLRLDARESEQNVVAIASQAQAAQTELELAQKDYARQLQLHEKQFISQAALERAETVFRAAQARARAAQAQAQAARAQSGYSLVRAPFAGVVADVSVALGDMAMPGSALLTLYDPAALRVTAAVPQSTTDRLGAQPRARIELPGLPAAQSVITPAQVQILPMADASTHTVEIRANLPRGNQVVTPGMFARLWLPEVSTAATARITVPVEAVVRRGEMTALYVLNPQGKPVLRQVRLGQAREGSIEILSGLMPGEQVVTNPQAAARMR